MEIKGPRCSDALKFKTSFYKYDIKPMNTVMMDIRDFSPIRVNKLSQNVVKEPKSPTISVPKIPIIKRGMSIPSNYLARNNISQSKTHFSIMLNQCPDGM